MRAFLYCCPTTAFRVAGYCGDESVDDPCNYVAVTCYVCGKIHLVNPANGAVLDEHEQDDLAFSEADIQPESRK